MNEPKRRYGPAPREDAMRKRIDLRVSDELYERLRARALVSDESVGQYARDVLLAAAMLGEDPLSVIRGVLADPNGERSRVVRKVPAAGRKRLRA